MNQDMVESNDYDLLVQKIHNSPILCSEVEKLKQTSSAINLISTSWLSDLEKYPLYQTHAAGKVKYNQGHQCGSENKAFVRYIKDRIHAYKVIVAGEWILKESDTGEFSLAVRNCKPLDVIGSSMREDDSKKLHTGARGFITPCHPLLCAACTEYHKMYKIPFPPKNWCVLSLKVFDGENIFNVCTSVIRKALLSLPSFMAIVHMEIYSRVSFGDNYYKICGNIDRMIIFQALSINSEKFFLPSSGNLEYAIEYPTGMVQELVDETK